MRRVLVLVAGIKMQQQSVAGASKSCRWALFSFEGGGVRWAEKKWYCAPLSETQILYKLSLQDAFLDYNSVSESILCGSCWQQTVSESSTMALGTEITAVTHQLTIPSLFYGYNGPADKEIHKFLVGVNRNAMVFEKNMMPTAIYFPLPFSILHEPKHTRFKILCSTLLMKDQLDAILVVSKNCNRHPNLYDEPS